MTIFHWSFLSSEYFGTSYVFYGNLGVFLFFVISGFLLWNPSQKNVLLFLIHRLIRIYPGYIGAIIIASAISVLFLDKFLIIRLQSFLLFPVGPYVHPLGGVEWTLTYELYF